MIQRCSTSGCSTLTFGETCLGCEQKKASVRRTFPRGRPFERLPVGDEAAAHADAAASSSARSD